MLFVPLRLKFILAMVPTLGAVMVIGAWQFSSLQSRMLETEARTRAEMVLSFSEACRSYAKLCLRPAIDALTDEMIIEAKSGTFVTKGIMGFFGQNQADYSYRQPTSNPLNPVDQADAFEEDLLERFRQDSNLRELKGDRVVEGSEQYYIARPIVVEQACLACHGNPEDAPITIIERYGETNGFHWVVGETVSATLISIPTDDLRSQQASIMRLVVGGFSIMTMIMILVTYTLFERLVNSRIQKAAVVMDRFSKAPCSEARIGDQGRDELGALAKTFDSMADSLQESHDLLEKKVEQRTSSLAAAEARLHAILESVGESITVTDRGGVMRYVNPAYSRLTGYEATEVLGQSSSLTSSRKQSPAFYRAMWSTILEGRTWKGEMVNRRKDGSLYDVHLTIAPVCSADQQITGFVAVQRNVTEQKELEDRLNGAREAAEAAAKAKSNFLANMSHEIRTPMNGIIGMTELALRADLDEGQRENLGTIRDCAESLHTLLNDILDFSKIEAGMLELEVIDFNIETLLDGTVDILSQPAAAKQLDLICAIGADVPKQLRGDPVRLRQVLLNLGTNAIKFTGTGAVQINVELRGQSDSQALLEFSVRDTGIGISPDRQAQIFDEFVQADSSTTRKFGGTGLGLAICKRIVDVMSGEMQVVSAADAGSTFSFVIALPLAAGSSEKPAVTGTQLSKRTILVQDSSREVRSMIQRTLEERGAEVKVAEDRPQALGFLRADRENGAAFDMVIWESSLFHLNSPDVRQALEDGLRRDGSSCVIGSRREFLSSDLRDSSGAWGDLLIRPLKSSALLRSLNTCLCDSPGGCEEVEPTGEPATKILRVSMSVLLVEDNLVNQKVATRLLERHGCVVRCAEHGGVALEILKEQTFDLVFMDVQMPEMDGIECTRIIRSGGDEDLPIIAMTAHAMKGDREHCLAAGMSDYISKPVRAEELQELLRRWADELQTRSDNSRDARDSRRAG